MYAGTALRFDRTDGHRSASPLMFRTIDGFDHFTFDGRSGTLVLDNERGEGVVSGYSFLPR